MAISARNLTSFKTEADPTHFDRIPHPKEIVRSGGLPGVEYCYVLGKNIGKWQKMSRGDKSQQWSLTRNIPVISIAGPKGFADSVVVMSRGIPIPGADPENGTRRWYVDNELISLTGLKPSTFVDEIKGDTGASREPRQEAEAAKGGSQPRESSRNPA
jgi:hypothetical protein